MNPCSIPYIRFPLRFKLCTLAKNCSPSIAPDGHGREISFRERSDQPQDKLKRSNCAIKAQSVSVLDWILHIYYTHFRCESPICFQDQKPTGNALYPLMIGMVQIFIFLLRKPVEEFGFNFICIFVNIFTISQVPSPHACPLCIERIMSDNNPVSPDRKTMFTFCNTR